MNNDQQLAAALMARFELHFARQSEMLESITLRMQSSLARANALRDEQKEMSAALDGLEAGKISQSVITSRPMRDGKETQESS